MTDQTLKLVVLNYWLLTTAIGVYWMTKNPSRFEDKTHFTLLDVLGNVFPSALFSWILVPVMAMSLVKFKR